MNETKPIEFQREKQRLSLSRVISVICIGLGLFVAINPNDILQIADSDTSSLPFGKFGKPTIDLFFHWYS